LVVSVVSVAVVLVFYLFLVGLQPVFHQGAPVSLQELVVTL